MNDAKLLSQALSRKFYWNRQGDSPPLACQENELPEGGLIETHRADPCLDIKIALCYCELDNFDCLILTYMIASVVFNQFYPFIYLGNVAHLSVACGSVE